MKMGEDVEINEHSCEAGAISSCVSPSAGTRTCVCACVSVRAHVRLSVYLCVCVGVHMRPRFGHCTSVMLRHFHLHFLLLLLPT